MGFKIGEEYARITRSRNSSKNFRRPNYCKKITNIEIYYDKILENTSVEKFKKSLIGQTFRKLIDMANIYYLF